METKRKPRNASPDVGRLAGATIALPKLGDLATAEFLAHDFPEMRDSLG
jgi:hypothetical protein